MSKVVRDFTWDEDLDEVLEDLDPVEQENWRHGQRCAYVFERDGAHWLAWIDVHHEEGWQKTDTLRAVQVHAVEVKTTKWVPVKATPAPRVACSVCGATHNGEDDTLGVCCHVARQSESKSGG